MKDVKTKVVVSGPNGFYYREEHEWRGMSPEMSAWFTKQQNAIVAYITKATSNKDGGELTATLEATVDGVVVSPILVTGISKKEVAKFERMYKGIHDDALGQAEKHAK